MRVCRDLVSDMLSTHVVQVDGKQQNVAALSAEVVESVMSSCKSRVGTAEATGTPTPSSGSVPAQNGICPAENDRAGWGCLPAPALALIGKDLSVRSLAAARIVCKAWSLHLGEALKQAMPAAFLSGAATGSGRRPAGTILCFEGLLTYPLTCRTHPACQSSV